MKKIMLLLVFFSTFLCAQSQMRWTRVSFVKADHITLDVGTAANFTNPLFVRTNNMSYGSDVLDCTSKRLNPGFNISLNVYSSHTDLTNFLSAGIELNLYFLKGQWDATFSSEVMKDPNYYYRFYGKYSEVGLNMGVLALTFRLSDSFELLATAGVSVGFLMCGDVKSEAVRVKNDEVYSDPALNEWHKSNDEAIPSFEIGIYGKLGAYYRLTDYFSVGLFGMYRHKFLGTATSDKGDFASAQNMGYGVTSYVGKLNFGSAMLSLRFDLE